MSEHEPTINEETATEMVDDFFDYYGANSKRKMKETGKALEMCHIDFVAAVMDGRIEMAMETVGDVEEMVATQHLKIPFKDKRGDQDMKVIRYLELRGKSKKAGGNLDPTAIDARALALCVSLSGKPALLFDKLRGVDALVAINLGTFFLVL